MASHDGSTYGSVGITRKGPGWVVAALGQERSTFSSARPFASSSTSLSR